MASLADTAEIREGNCIICRSVTSPTSDLRLATVTQGRGKKTILNASIRRGDSDLTQYMASNPRILKIHESCRILYSSNRQCVLDKRKSGSVGPDQSES